MRIAIAVMALSLLASPAIASLEDAKAAIDSGDGVAAIRSLEPLADGGDVTAMMLLAGVYRDGAARISRDSTRAVHWFRKAAEQGNATAQTALGRAYASGDGVARSPNQAYYWLGIAAGNAPAATRASLLDERNAAGRDLTSGEIEQADEMAAQFLGRPVSTAPEPRRPMALLPQPEHRQAPKPAPKREKPTASARSAGSGFIVTADGKIVTNAHVVPECKAIRVSFADGAKRTASVLAHDKREDLALLKTESSDLPVAQFRGGVNLRSGDGVVVIGFPLSTVLSAEANVTAGVVSAMAGMKGDQRFFQLTAPVQKGNSGGPLADMSGAVIGMVSKKLDAMKIADRTGDLPQNVNFAIKSERVENFLAAHDVQVQTAPEGMPLLSVADVGERIKRVTVFVECER